MQTEPMILLRKIKYGEADLIVHGLLPSGEKINLIARNALRSRKRFGGGVLEPTHYIEASLKKSTQPEGLSLLQDARLLENFSELRKDYDRLQLALRFVETVDRSSPGGPLSAEGSGGIFSLLGHALRALTVAELKDLERIEIQFTLKFLRLHGVLETEDWMKSYLALSLEDKTAVFPAVTEAIRKSLASRLNQYIRTGN